MNLIKEYLGNTFGANLFPIIAMMGFMLFFVIMLIYTFSIHKDEIGEISHLPLEKDDNQNDDRD